jgi:molybdenum cofactor biosynthesis enzyme MoaA
MKLEDIGFYTLTDSRAENVSMDSQMKRCEMIINDYCNFKCEYCRGLTDRVFGDRKRKELTLEEIKRNIDYWCEGQPLKNIRFSGGEPTYHKNIVEIVAYAKSKGIERIAISTNGSNKTELYERLVEAGCNDFSISLDAADAATGDMMAGNIMGAWDKVVRNIRIISQLTYVTVGVVFTPENIEGFMKIVEFANGLGVSDIRVIPSAQWNQALPELSAVDKDLLAQHPILAYRIQNFMEGKTVRGLDEGDTTKCPLVYDDSVIAGQEHYPCVIYMREQGTPIGEVGPNMREERIAWDKTHDTHCDPICKGNCLDVCRDYNNKAVKTIYGE